MNIAEQIKFFVEPRSVALVGVSSRTGEYSFNILENIIKLGYKGKVYPVNPRIDNILGRKVYSTVEDIDDSIDLAVISTSRSQVPDIVKGCVRKRVKAIIVVGQGFADANDEEGTNLQKTITELIKNTGTRIIGPNTIGISNPFIDFSTSFISQPEMRKLSIGVVCQTGVFLGSFPDLNLLGKGIDLGNTCDIDFADCLEYFESDQDIKMIFLHIEGIKNGKSFMEVAKRVAKKKPIFAFKTGTSPHSAKIAESHTGSIIGNNEIWDIALKQCGIIRVSDFDEIKDLTKIFSHLPLMKGRSIGIITLSGGLGLMSMDACDEYKLNISEFSPETKEKIIGISPKWLAINNPVDIWPAVMMSRRPFGEILETVIEAVLRDDKIDAVLLIIGAWFDSISPPFSDSILEISNRFKDKPIAWAPYEGWMSNMTARDIEEKLDLNGRVAIFSSPKRAIRALSKLVEYSEFLKR